MTFPSARQVRNFGSLHCTFGQCRSVTNTIFLWGGHPARPLPIAAEGANAPQDVFLHNWDAPGHLRPLLPVVFHFEPEHCVCVQVGVPSTEFLRVGI